MQSAAMLRQDQQHARTAPCSTSAQQQELCQVELNCCLASGLKAAQAARLLWRGLPEQSFSENNEHND